MTSANTISQYLNGLLSALADSKAERQLLDLLQTKQLTRARFKVGFYIKPIVSY